MSEVSIAIPDKLKPVWFDDAGGLAKADIRGSYGGRGSAKTRTFAKMCAVFGYMYGTAGISGQILCARQYMSSLSDSSLEECKRAIEDEPFLKSYYEIGEKYIKSIDGRIWFAFAGLDRNINSIKSKGRILVCWVDEAEPVTDSAWAILIPTLREESEGWNAELWVTWNPRSRVAAVESRFRNSKDKLVRIVQMNWRDNPKFPAILERSRQRDLKERPDEYEHIWEGAFGNSQGSILGRLVDQADKEGRIHNQVKFDHDGLGIELSCDLGFRDTTYFWYWQRKKGGFSLVHAEGASGWDAQDWIDRVKILLTQYKMPLRKIWLPHDAKVKTFQSKHSSIEQFIEAFGNDKIAIIPVSKKEAQINAARTVIKSCEFNSDTCLTGVDGLRGWEFAYNEDTQSFSKDPLHNWASHPSDAFAYGCQVMQEHMTEPFIDNSTIRGITVGNNTVTLNELWASNKQATKRI